MLKNVVIAFVVSAVMIGTSWAFWQEAAPSRPNPNPGPGSGPGGFSFFATSDPTVTLLKIPEVQTELKLEEDKAKKIDEIDTEANRERARLLAEYNAKVNELNKKSAGDALGLLSDAQRRRTEQLHLQQQGSRAWSTDAVAEKLGLTKAQRDEIAKLAQQNIRRRDPSSAPSESIQQQILESNKRATETREKLFAVLTPEQKAKWSEMTGETFKFPPPQWSTTRGTSPRSSEPAKPSAENKKQ